jgi:hypothetical protein
MSVNTASAKLITDETPLVIPPSLAARIGLVEATILQQIHYYVQKSNNIIDGFRWVYNTYQQWQEQFPFLSLRSIRRAITNLEDLKLIRSERMEAKNWYQRKWYTVCYETLEALISPKCPNWTHPLGQSGHFDPSNLDTSYTKTSTKDLSETTDIKPTTHPVQEVEQQGVNFEALATSIGQTEEKESVLGKAGESGTTEQEKSEGKDTSLFLSDEIKIDPQLKKQVEEAISPAPMNPQIKKAVLATRLEAVQDAIAVVKQRKEVGRVKNPAGLFVKAIKELWKPSAGKDAQNIPNLSDGFSRWFDAARAAGLVIGTQVIDGQIWVYDANAKAFTYEQMALLHPLESFKGAASIPLEKKPRLVSVAAKESVDLSDVLAIIDNHFSRLKWSAQRIREFLVQTYGKYSRALLDDDDLIDLQVRLQAL